MLKKLSIIVFALALLLIGLSGNVHAEGFSLTEESCEVKLNGSKWLLYSGGSGNITWTSSDPTVATVSDTGTINGLKIGETTITAQRGEETDTCVVKVVYDSISIKANQNAYVSAVNLVLGGVHETETLYGIVKDSKGNEVNDAIISWNSSDPSVATIDDSTGKLTALKAGKTNITATAAGVTKTIAITVFNAPEFTDFQNATYKTNLEWNETSLVISGITPKDVSSTDYIYFIKPDNTRPELDFNSNGFLELNNLSYLNANTEENYLYSRRISEYAELSTDMYLTVIQREALEEPYYDENGNNIHNAYKYVVESKKIDKPELPPYNLILQSFSLTAGSKYGTEYSSIKLNYPSVTENRKFTLKVGKITDNSILEKIKNNDYTGIVDLLSYAKNNTSPIYNNKLTTTSTNYYRNDDTLFDGRNLMEDSKYYYIYVQLDDENGTYAPVEGVTLGQAYLSDISDYWSIFAYTSSDFKWDNLHSTYTPTEPVEPTSDPTVAPSVIPKAGTNVAIIITGIAGVTLIGIVCYRKYNKYRGI